MGYVSSQAYISQGEFLKIYATEFSKKSNKHFLQSFKQYNTQLEA